MTEARIALTTAGSKEEAQKLASALVSERLAACVNIVGPIESHYWWKGAIENATEYILLIKTTITAAERVQQRICELHSYELPEFIVLPIENGDAKYLEWLGVSVHK